jgi:hypothetical protein
MLTQVSEQQLQKATTVNENFEAVLAGSAFGVNWDLSVGLTFAYYGGRLVVDGVSTAIADGTLALSASLTNYISRTRAGVVSTNTTAFTVGNVPLYTALTNADGITTLTDYRGYLPFGGGFEPPVAGGSKRWITHPALTSLTDGTDTTPVNGTRYWCSVYIPHNVTLTGIGYLIGTVGGTNTVMVELKNAAGVSLANSITGGTTVGTLATFQQVAFTATYTVIAGWYYLCVQFNGTTARFRTIPANLGISQVAITGSAAGTFGTVAAITPGTTFTAGVGPIAFTY